MVTLAPAGRLIPLVGRSLVGEGASGDSAFLQGCATRLLQRIKFQNFCSAIQINIFSVDFSVKRVYFLVENLDLT